MSYCKLDDRIIETGEDIYVSTKCICYGSYGPGTFLKLSNPYNNVYGEWIDVINVKTNRYEKCHPENVYKYVEKLPLVDNLEKLFDGYCIIEKRTDKILTVKTKKECLKVIERYEKPEQLYINVFGFIKTDNGLRFVARMIVERKIWRLCED